MTLEELAREVQSVRRLQQEYFKWRLPQKLAECRDAEKRLDRHIAEILAPPAEPELFEDQP